MSYIQLTSPLVLHADPVLPGHAVTKRYVDSKKEFLQASWFTSGTVSVLRIPALSGDISSAAGSGTVSLLDNGVAAGTYTKVTVDSTGRVTAGGNLTAADIPSLDWNKITTGKPSTAAGYGINNLIALSGGTVSGHITSTADPTDNLHAVTKAYVDNNVTGVVSASLSPGDVVRKATDVTPSGFLRCNGGLIDRQVYPNLVFNIDKPITDKKTLDYTSYGVVGAGRPWMQQYDFNDFAGTGLNNWQKVYKLPGWDTFNASPVLEWFVLNGRIYFVTNKGGSGITNYSTALYLRSARLNTDGTMSDWDIKPISMDTNYSYARAVITRNKVIIALGSSTTYIQVLTANITSSGTIDTFTFDTVYSPGALLDFEFIAVKNKVYIIGGGGESGYTKNPGIYSANVNMNGTIGAFQKVGDLPTNQSRGRCVVTKNKIYYIGGYTANPTCYLANINADGTLGTWSSLTTADLPGWFHSFETLVTKNRLYLIGGVTGSGTRNNNVYSAAIDSNGDLGGWSIVGVTPFPTNYPSTALVVKNKILALDSQTSDLYQCEISGGYDDYRSFLDGTINKFDGSDITGDINIYTGSTSRYDSTMPGGGRPWEQQYLINNNTITDTQLGTWTTSTAPYNLPVYPVGRPNLFVTKNRVYLIGMFKTDANQYEYNTIYYSDVDQYGNLGVWVKDTRILPVSNQYSCSLIVKNKAYIFGGLDSSVVMVADVDSQGVIGNWTSTSGLPEVVRGSTAIYTKERIYLIGGDSLKNKTLTCSVNADGTLGQWEYGAVLPKLTENADMSPSLALTGDRLYVLLGGSPAVGYLPAIVGYINSEGIIESFSFKNTQTLGISPNGVVYVSKNNIYHISGYYPGSAGGSVDIDKLAIDQTGDITGEKITTGKTIPREATDGVSAMIKGKLYIFGGQNNANGSFYKTYMRCDLGTYGTSDYSAYYDGTIQIADYVTHFRLPDYSSKETNGINYYIKY